MLRPHRRCTLLVASLALLALVVADTSGMGPPAPKQDSQVSLVRPDDPPDDDAKGTLRIRSEKKGERFDVHVQKVDVDLVHELWIEEPDDSGLFVFVSTLDREKNELKYSVFTKKGDDLPLDAVDTEELIGRRVEVRSSDAVVLKGVVPPYGLSKKPVKAKAEILAPQGAPEPDMQGKLELRSKPDKGQERIDFKVKKVPFETEGPFRVFIENDLDVLTDVGELEQTGNSSGRFRRDTKQGQPLPLDVFGVIELAGRAIEVRDGDDVVFLAGVIPTPD
jgi:hypothetical protein